MKPAGEEASDTATITAPTKPQTERHQLASTGEVNGFISPSEETLPARQSAVPDGPAAPPNTLPGEPAMATWAPPERPASLLDGQHPPKPEVDMTPPQPRVEAEHQPRLSTNGLSSDSAETSVLSPTSLSDSDLLEAVLDAASDLIPEKPMPEEPADISVNVQIKKSPLPNAGNVTKSSESNTTGAGKGETINKISHLTETAGQEKGRAERERIVVKMSTQDEVVSCKHPDPKSNVTTLSEGIEGYDVPDGMQSDDLPSASEAVPPALTPEPKKSSLFKRNKKKSNQGKLSIKLNKDHVWNASLMMCLKGKSLFILFLLHLTFYILCMGYFSVY